MKVVLIILCILAALFFTASMFGLELTLRPFSVKLNTWMKGLGWLLTIVGMILLCLHYYKEGVEEGYKRGLQDDGKLHTNIQQKIFEFHKQAPYYTPN